MLRSVCIPSYFLTIQTTFSCIIVSSAANSWDFVLALLVRNSANLIAVDRFRPGWVYDTSDQPPVEAKSIPELAQKLDLDLDKLPKTVSEYNAACDNKPFDLMAGWQGNNWIGSKQNQLGQFDYKAPFYGVM